MRLLRGTAIAAVIALLTTGAIAAPVTYLNATTSLTVHGGEAGTGLVPFGGYFDYTDLGASELTTWSVDPVLIDPSGTVYVLSSLYGSPTDLGTSIVSSAFLPGLGTAASTELVGSNAKTTFTFESATGAPLDGWTFFFYAENDLFGFADDAAAFTGSIGGGDLELFQFDSAAGGLTVKMTGEEITGATLSLFGADTWTGFGTALEAGDLSVLSADGSNFATVGDLGLVLSFDLSGTFAELVINYDTQPDPPGVIPEPSTLVLLGLGFAGLAISRRRRAARKA